MTVRTVRSHHARGLLPPPEVRGRTGYYGPEHVERLRLIRRLQDEGLKLEGIRRLLGDSGERLLAVRRAAEVPPEAPEVVSGAELLNRLRTRRGQDLATLLDKATELGILVPLGDGTFELTSPVLITAAEQALANGITLEHALESIERVMQHSRAASHEFVKLFLDDMWRPFADAGLPDDRWEDLEQAVQDVRPLATQALLAVFRRTLDEEIERTFDDLARRLARGRR
jgi:DNA-binding transcriptional MerR regulator